MVAQRRILPHASQSPAFWEGEILKETSDVAQRMQKPHQSSLAVVRSRDEFKDFSQMNPLWHLPLRRRKDVAKGCVGARQQKPRREHDGQQPAELAGQLPAQGLHGGGVPRAARFPILAELLAQAAVLRTVPSAKVVVEAVVQNHELGLLPPRSSVTLRAYVDIPSMRICVDPALQKDHLGKAVTNELTTFFGVEPSGPKSLGIVGLQQAIAMLHGQHALRGESPEHLRHVHLGREVGHGCGRGLGVVGLPLEIQLARHVPFEIVDDPHQVVTARQLFQTCTQLPKRRQICSNLAPQLCMLHLHRHLNAARQPRPVHLRHGRRGEGLNLDGSQ
mmetsp:Transcript_71385/g.231976  ORF Transcript_71385/g.231976 Transcript_71385/m.231976 type:complete len:333 (+) Transcript_71385:228-1226(+)